MREWGRRKGGGVYVKVLVEGMCFGILGVKCGDCGRLRLESWGMFGLGRGIRWEVVMD